MTYRFFTIFLCNFLFIFFISGHSYAWNMLGHMVIANIAYKNLDPKAREKVDHLVSYFHNEYPNMNSFMQLATWPDALRSQRIGTYMHWHYIDVPLSLDGSSFKNPIDTDNAVWAFNNIKGIVKYPHANIYERARFLAFLVHIVGDLHQPLHTVTLISTNHPSGDKGGNLYYIKVKNRRLKLHYLWDQGVGIFSIAPTNENAALLTNSIMSLYPKSSFGKQTDDLNPSTWTKEGMENARQYVYRIPEDETASADYIEIGKKIVSQQIALASYRLSAILNELLKE